MLFFKELRFIPKIGMFIVALTNLLYTLDMSHMLQINLTEFLNLPIFGGNLILSLNYFTTIYYFRRFYHDQKVSYSFCSGTVFAACIGICPIIKGATFP